MHIFVQNFPAEVLLNYRFRFKGRQRIRYRRYQGKLHSQLDKVYSKNLTTNYLLVSILLSLIRLSGCRHTCNITLSGVGRVQKKGTKGRKKGKKKKGHGMMKSHVQNASCLPSFLYKLVGRLLLPLQGVVTCLPLAASTTFSSYSMLSPSLLLL